VGAVALDSSVVIGLLRADDVHHTGARDAVAEARLAGSVFVLPAITLAEAMVGAYRAGTAADRRRRILALFGPVRPVDEQIALAAAALRARHRHLRLSDALVIATGIVADAEVLTCDQRLGGIDPRVRVLV
jgi:predicted nucleic acid-binding protein